MTEGFGDAVAKFSSEVDDAVSRARRAAADAREQAARFRRESKSNAEQARSGELRIEPDAVTDSELRQSAVQFRGARGLAVEEFPPDTDLTTAPDLKTPPVAQSGDDDDDFSQEQIMTRY